MAAANLLPYPPHLHPSLRGEAGSQYLTSEEGSYHEKSRYHLPPYPGQGRPPSAISSHQRYKTPMVVSSPPVFSTSAGRPPVATALNNYKPPQMQPMPSFSTPSAFDRDNFRNASAPSYIPAPGPSTLVPSNAGIYPPGTLPPLPLYNSPYDSYAEAVENIHSRLRTLMGRIERLENPQSSARNPPNRWADSTHNIHSIDPSQWNTNNVGLWSLVFKPLSRVLVTISWLLEFLLGPTYAHGPAHPGLIHPSPVLVIARRLMLDSSFLLVCYVTFRYLARRSGIRRDSIRAAILNLFRELLNQRRC